jgi:hypothetical protein
LGRRRGGSLAERLDAVRNGAIDDDDDDDAMRMIAG